jgi:hypothetical protein
VTKSKILMLVLFVITLGAGASAGMLYERHDLAGGCSRATQMMLQELKLTPDQETKMHGIWAGVSDVHRQRRMRKDELIKEKDTAVLGLLSEEQKQKFSVIQKKYDEQAQELDQKVKRTDEEAVAKTTGILDDQQRAKFIEWRKAHDDLNAKNKPQ